MDRLKMHSPDLIAANVERIAELFPSVVTESLDESGNPVRAIDFDALRQELSDHIVDGLRERYQLDWPGKRAARLAANAPIAKTLRPVREESVDFDTTKNLFIEGDNLDALKLLQESYLGKVKLIYIDPPYNTGKDEFVYPDDYSEGAVEHLARSGEVNDAGERLRSNPEASGRFHSGWLDMIYPRLRLARSLLTTDGYIVVSIDDQELSAMELLLDEVMGASNKLAVLVWDRNRKNDARFFSVGHEYMLVYARDKAALTEGQTRLREPQPGFAEAREFIADAIERLGENWEAVQGEWRRWTAGLPKDDERRKLGRFSKVGPRGPFRDDGNINWPGGGGPRYEVLHPKTGKPVKLPTSGWRFPTKERFDEVVREGRVIFGADETTVPRVLSFLFESDGLVMGSVHYSYAQTATTDFEGLMGGKMFDNPKNWKDLARLVEYLSGPADIVLDFFAGSGSTGHAVMDLNASAGSERRFVLVQVAEPVPEKSVAAAHGYGTIADIARDRLRRAGAAVDANSTPDTGFRVLRIDTTNMSSDPRPPDREAQGELDLHVDSVKTGRTGEDLLFQVLTDWGLDLALPIEVEQIGGIEVFDVDAGSLVLAVGVGAERERERERERDLSAAVDAIVARQPLRVVFLDADFADDAARINTEQVFRERSPHTEVRTV